jgi:hypothetical protein
VHRRGVSRFEALAGAAKDGMSDLCKVHTAPEVVAIGMFLWINRVSLSCPYIGFDWSLVGAVSTSAVRVLYCRRAEGAP